ncbi:Hypothetical protein, putative [Bodo saltans]|uniref:Phorbol-ester/DAG-type domain-containing protein n=1 Tax=Bodo saltans TaxID=75058 RepID=A0A0S4JBD6_BODSA|nr:Hypothetical protein, putative [Bodo saltans]|eukprot:CUG87522.1 Hypothetical protein, putative [Bodo saltans]
MLEKSIAQLLSSFLRRYLEGVSADQLQMHPLSGHMALKHLNVREDALQRVGLPLRVVRGTIDELDITIPWVSLRARGCQAALKGLHLICELSVPSPKAQQAARLPPGEVEASLVAMELAAQQHQYVQGEQKKQKRSSLREGIVRRVLQRLLDGFVLTVERISIELRIPHPTAASTYSSITIQLDSLHAKQTWRLRNLDHVLEGKSMELEGLSVSFSEQLTNNMAIPPSGASLSTQPSASSSIQQPVPVIAVPILRPVSVQAEWTPSPLSTSSTNDEGGYYAIGSASGITVAVSPELVLLGKRVQRQWKLLRRFSEFQLLKPTSSIGSAASSPDVKSTLVRQWWRYASRCVLILLHEHRSQHVVAYGAALLRQEYSSSYARTITELDGSPVHWQSLDDSVASIGDVTESVSSDTTSSGERQQQRYLTPPPRCATEVNADSGHVVVEQRHQAVYFQVCSLVELLQIRAAVRDAIRHARRQVVSERELNESTATSDAEDDDVSGSPMRAESPVREGWLSWVRRGFGRRANNSGDAHSVQQRHAHVHGIRSLPSLQLTLPTIEFMLLDHSQQLPILKASINNVTVTRSTTSYFPGGLESLMCESISVSDGRGREIVGTPPGCSAVTLSTTTTTDDTTMDPHGGACDVSVSLKAIDVSLSWVREIAVEYATPISFAFRTLPEMIVSLVAVKAPRGKVVSVAEPAVMLSPQPSISAEVVLPPLTFSVSVALPSIGFVFDELTLNSSSASQPSRSVSSTTRIVCTFADAISASGVRPSQGPTGLTKLSVIGASITIIDVSSDIGEHAPVEERHVLLDPVTVRASHKVPKSSGGAMGSSSRTLVGEVSSVHIRANPRLVGLLLKTADRAKRTSEVIKTQRQGYASLSALVDSVSGPHWVDVSMAATITQRDLLTVPPHFTTVSNSTLVFSGYFGDTPKWEWEFAQQVATAVSGTLPQPTLRSSLLNSGDRGDVCSVQVRRRTAVVSLQEAVHLESRRVVVPQLRGEDADSTLAVIVPQDGLDVRDTKVFVLVIVHCRSPQCAKSVHRSMQMCFSSFEEPSNVPQSAQVKRSGTHHHATSNTSLLAKPDMFPQSWTIKQLRLSVLLDPKPRAGWPSGTPTEVTDLGAFAVKLEVSNVIASEDSSGMRTATIQSWLIDATQELSPASSAGTGTGSKPPTTRRYELLRVGTSTGRLLTVSSKTSKDETTTSRYPTMDVDVYLPMVNVRFPPMLAVDFLRTAPSLWQLVKHARGRHSAALTQALSSTAQLSWGTWAFDEPVVASGGSMISSAVSPAPQLSHTPTTTQPQQAHPPHARGNGLTVALSWEGIACLISDPDGFALGVHLDQTTLEAVLPRSLSEPSHVRVRLQSARLLHNAGDFLSLQPPTSGPKVVVSLEATRPSGTACWDLVAVVGDGLLSVHAAELITVATAADHALQPMIASITTLFPKTPDRNRSAVSFLAMSTNPAATASQVRWTSQEDDDAYDGPSDTFNETFALLRNELTSVSGGNGARKSYRLMRKYRRQNLSLLLPRGGATPGPLSQTPLSLRADKPSKLSLDAWLSSFSLSVERVVLNLGNGRKLNTITDSAVALHWCGTNITIAKPILADPNSNAHIALQSASVALIELRCQGSHHADYIVAANITDASIARRLKSFECTVAQVDVNLETLVVSIACETASTFAASVDAILRLATVSDLRALVSQMRQNAAESDAGVSSSEGVPPLSCFDDIQSLAASHRSIEAPHILVTSASILARQSTMLPSASFYPTHEIESVVGFVIKHLTVCALGTRAAPRVSLVSRQLSFTHKRCAVFEGEVRVLPCSSTSVWSWDHAEHILLTGLCFDGAERAAVLRHDQVNGARTTPPCPPFFSSSTVVTSPLLPGHVPTCSRTTSITYRPTLSAVVLPVHLFHGVLADVRGLAALGRLLDAVALLKKMTPTVSVQTLTPSRVIAMHQHQEVHVDITAPLIIQSGDHALSVVVGPVSINTSVTANLHSNDRSTEVVVHSVTVLLEHMNTDSDNTRESTINDDRTAKNSAGSSLLELKDMKAKIVTSLLHNHNDILLPQHHQDTTLHVGTACCAINPSIVASAAAIGRAIAGVTPAVRSFRRLLGGAPSGQCVTQLEVVFDPSDTLSKCLTTADVFVLPATEQDDEGPVVSIIISDPTGAVLEWREVSGALHSLRCFYDPDSNVAEVEGLDNMSSSLLLRGPGASDLVTMIREGKEHVSVSPTTAPYNVTPTLTHSPPFIAAPRTRPEWSRRSLRLELAQRLALQLGGSVSVLCLRRDHVGGPPSTLTIVQENERVEVRGVYLPEVSIIRGQHTDDCASCKGYGAVLWVPSVATLACSRTSGELVVRIDPETEETPMGHQRRGSVPFTDTANNDDAEILLDAVEKRIVCNIPPADTLRAGWETLTLWTSHLGSVLTLVIPGSGDALTNALTSRGGTRGGATPPPQQPSPKSTPSPISRALRLEGTLPDIHVSVPMSIVASSPYASVLTLDVKNTVLLGDGGGAHPRAPFATSLMDDADEMSTNNDAPLFQCGVLRVELHRPQPSVLFSVENISVGKRHTKAGEKANDGAFASPRPNTNAAKSFRMANPKLQASALKLRHKQSGLLGSADMVRGGSRGDEDAEASDPDSDTSTTSNLQCSFLSFASEQQQQQPMHRRRSSGDEHFLESGISGVATGGASDIVTEVFIVIDSVSLGNEQLSSLLNIGRSVTIYRQVVIACLDTMSASPSASPARTPAGNVSPAVVDLAVTSRVVSSPSQQPALRFQVRDARITCGPLKFTATELSIHKAAAQATARNAIEEGTTPRCTTIVASWKAAHTTFVQSGLSPSRRVFSCSLSTLHYKLDQDVEASPTPGALFGDQFAAPMSCATKGLHHSVTCGKIEIVTAPEHDISAIREAVASITSVVRSLAESFKPSSVSQLQQSPPPPPSPFAGSHHRAVEHHVEVRIHSVTAVIHTPSAYQRFGPLVIKSDPIHVLAVVGSGGLSSLRVGEIVWAAHVKHQELLRHATPELLKMSRASPTLVNVSDADVNPLSGRASPTSTAANAGILDVNVQLGTLECQLNESLLTALEDLVTLATRRDDEDDGEMLDSANRSTKGGGGPSMDATFSGSLAATMSLSDNTQVAMSPLATFLAAPPRVNWNISCQQIAVYLGDDTVVTVAVSVALSSPTGNVEEVTAMCRGAVQLLPMARVMPQQKQVGSTSPRWQETAPVTPILWVEWTANACPTRTRVMLGPVTFETSTANSKQALERPLRFLPTPTSRRGSAGSTTPHLADILMGQSIHISQLILSLEHSLVSPVQSHVSAVHVALPAADCRLLWSPRTLQSASHALLPAFALQLRLRGVAVRLSDDNGLSAEAQWVGVLVDVLPTTAATAIVLSAATPPPSALRVAAEKRSDLSVNIPAGTRPRVVAITSPSTAATASAVTFASAATSPVGPLPRTSADDVNQRRERRLAWFVKNVRRLLTPEDSADDATRRLVETLVRGRGVTKKPPWHHVDASDLYVALKMKRRVHLQIKAVQAGVFAPTSVDAADPFEPLFQGMIAAVLVNGVYSLGDQSVGCGGVELLMARPQHSNNSTTQSCTSSMEQLTALRYAMQEDGVEPGDTLSKWPIDHSCGTAELLRLSVSKVSWQRQQRQLNVDAVAIAGDIGKALPAMYAVVSHMDFRRRRAATAASRGAGSGRAPSTVPSHQTPTERFADVCHRLIQERRATSLPKHTHHMSALLGEAVDRWSANCTLGACASMMPPAEEDTWDNEHDDTTASSEFTIDRSEHYLLGFVWFLPKAELEAELRALAERQTSKQRTTRIGPLEIQVIPVGTSYAMYHAYRTAGDLQEDDGTTMVDSVDEFFESDDGVAGDAAPNNKQGSGDSSELSLWSFRCPLVRANIAMRDAVLSLVATEASVSQLRSALNASSTTADGHVERTERLVVTIHTVSLHDRCPTSCFPKVLTIGPQQGGEGGVHQAVYVGVATTKSTLLPRRGVVSVSATTSQPPTLRTIKISLGPGVVVHNSKLLRDVFACWNQSHALRPTRWSQHKARRASAIPEPPTKNTIQIQWVNAEALIPREMHDALSTVVAKAHLSRFTLSIRKVEEPAALSPDPSLLTDGVRFLLVDLELAAPLIQLLTVAEGDVKHAENRTLFEVFSPETLTFAIRNQQTHRPENTGGIPQVSVHLDGRHANISGQGSMEGLALVLELSGRMMADFHTRELWKDHGPNRARCCRGGCSVQLPCRRCFDHDGLWVTTAPLWLDGSGGVPNTCRGNVPHHDMSATMGRNVTPTLTMGDVHFDEYETWLWTHAFRFTPHATAEDPSGATPYYLEATEELQIVRSLHSTHAGLYEYTHDALVAQGVSLLHKEGEEERLADRIVCLFVPQDLTPGKVQRKSARVNLNGSTSRPGPSISSRIGYAVLAVCPTAAAAEALVNNIQTVLGRIRQKQVIPVQLQSPPEVWWTSQSYHFGAITLHLEETGERLLCEGDPQDDASRDINAVRHSTAIRCTMRNASYTQRCRTPDWHLGLFAEEGSLDVILKQNEAPHATPCMSLMFGENSHSPLSGEATGAFNNEDDNTGPRKTSSNGFAYTAVLIHNAATTLEPIALVGLAGPFPAIKNHCIVLPANTTLTLTDGCMAHLELIARFWVRFMPVYWDAQACFKPALLRCIPMPMEAPFQLVTWSVAAPDLIVSVLDRTLRRDALRLRCRGLGLRWEMNGKGSTHLAVSLAGLRGRCPRERKAIMCFPDPQCAHHHGVDVVLSKSSIMLPPTTAQLCTQQAATAAVFFSRTVQLISLPQQTNPSSHSHTHPNLRIETVLRLPMIVVRLPPAHAIVDILTVLRGRKLLLQDKCEETDYPVRILTPPQQVCDGLGQYNRAQRCGDQWAWGQRMAPSMAANASLEVRPAEQHTDVTIGKISLFAPEAGSSGTGLTLDGRSVSYAFHSTQGVAEAMVEGIRLRTKGKTGALPSSSSSSCSSFSNDEEAVPFSPAALVVAKPFGAWEVSRVLAPIDVNDAEIVSDDGDAEELLMTQRIATSPTDRNVYHSNSDDEEEDHHAPAEDHGDDEHRNWPLWIPSVRVRHTTGRCGFHRFGCDIPPLLPHHSRRTTMRRSQRRSRVTVQPVQLTLSDADVALISNSWRSHARWILAPSTSSEAPASQGASPPVAQPITPLTGCIEIEFIHATLLVRGAPFFIAVVEGRPGVVSNGEAHQLPLIIEVHRESHGGSACAIPSIHICCSDPRKQYVRGLVFDMAHSAVGSSDVPWLLLRKQPRGVVPLPSSNSVSGSQNRRQVSSATEIGTVIRLDVSTVKAHVDPITVQSLLEFTSARRLTTTSSNLILLRRQSAGPLVRQETSTAFTDGGDGDTEAVASGRLPPVSGDWHVQGSTSVVLAGDLWLSNRRRLVVHYPTRHTPMIDHDERGGAAGRPRVSVVLDGAGHSVYLTHDVDEGSPPTADNTRWNVVVENDVHLILKDVTLICMNDVPLRSLWYCSTGASVRAVRADGCTVQYVSKAEDDGELYLVPSQANDADNVGGDVGDDLLADLTEANIPFSERTGFGLGSEDGVSAGGIGTSDDQSVHVSSEDWAASAFSSSADFLNDFQLQDSSGVDSAFGAQVASFRSRPVVDLDVHVSVRHVALTAAGRNDSPSVTIAWDSLTTKLVTASTRVHTQQWKTTLTNLRVLLHTTAPTHRTRTNISAYMDGAPLFTISSIFAAHRWVLDQTKSLSLRDLRRERLLMELGAVQSQVHSQSVYALHRLTTAFRDVLAQEDSSGLRRRGAESAALDPSSPTTAPPITSSTKTTQTEADLVPRVIKVKFDVRSLHIEMQRFVKGSTASPPSSPVLHRLRADDDVVPVISLAIKEISVQGRCVLPSMAHNLNCSMATTVSVYHPSCGDWEPFLEESGFVFTLEGVKRGGTLCHQITADAVNMVQVNASKHMMTALLLYAEHMKDMFAPGWAQEALQAQSDAMDSASNRSTNNTTPSAVAPSSSLHSLADPHQVHPEEKPTTESMEHEEPFAFSRPNTPPISSGLENNRNSQAPTSLATSAMQRRAREDEASLFGYTFRNETALPLLIFESPSMQRMTEDGADEEGIEDSFIINNKSNGTIRQPHQRWLLRARLEPGFHGVLELDERCQPYALRFELQLCDPFSLNLGTAHTSYIPFTSQHAAVVDISLHQQQQSAGRDKETFSNEPVSSALPTTIVGLVHVHSGVSFINQSYLSALRVQCLGMPATDLAHPNGIWEATISSRLEEGGPSRPLDDGSNAASQSASPPMSWMTAQYDSQKSHNVGWRVTYTEATPESGQTVFASQVLASLLIFDTPSVGQRRCFPVRLDPPAPLTSGVVAHQSMYLLCTVHCIAATRGTLRGNVGQRYLTFSTPMLFVNHVPLPLRVLMAGDHEGRQVLSRRTITAGSDAAVHSAVFEDVDEQVQGSSVVGGPAHLFIGAAVVGEQGWFVRSESQFVQLVRHTTEPLRLRLRDARRPKQRIHILVDVAWHSTITHRGRAVATSLMCTFYSPFIFFNHVGPSLEVLHEGRHVAGYPPGWVLDDETNVVQQLPSDSSNKPSTHQSSASARSRDSASTRPPLAMTSNPAAFVPHDFSIVSISQISPLDVCVACGEFILSNFECHTRPEHHGIEECRRCRGHCHAACSPAVRFSSCLQRHDRQVFRTDPRIILFTPSSRWSPFKATIQLALRSGAEGETSILNASAPHASPSPSRASYDASNFSDEPLSPRPMLSAGGFLTTAGCSAPIEVGAVEADGCVIVRSATSTRLVAVRASVGPGVYVRSKLLTFSAFCVVRNVTSSLSLGVMWTPPSSVDKTPILLMTLAPGEEREVSLPHLVQSDLEALLPLHLSLSVEDATDRDRCGEFVNHRSLPWTVTDVGRTMLKFFDVGTEFDLVQPSDWDGTNDSISGHHSSEQGRAILGDSFPSTTPRSKSSQQLLVAAQSSRVGASVLVALTESTPNASPLRVVNQTWAAVTITQHARRARRAPVDYCRVEPFTTTGFVFDDHEQKPLEVQVSLCDGMCIVLDPLRCTGTQNTSDMAVGAEMFLPDFLQPHARSPSPPTQDDASPSAPPSAMRRRRGAVLGGPSPHHPTDSHVFGAWSTDTPPFIVRSAGTGRFSVSMEVGRHAMLLVIRERQPRCVLTLQDITWVLAQPAAAEEAPFDESVTSPRSSLDGHRRYNLRKVVETLIGGNPRQRLQDLSGSTSTASGQLMLPNVKDHYRMIVRACRAANKSLLDPSQQRGANGVACAVLHSHRGEDEGSSPTLSRLLHFEGTAVLELPAPRSTAGTAANDIVISVTIQKKTLLEYVSVYQGTHAATSLGEESGMFHVDTEPEGSTHSGTTAQLGASWLFVRKENSLAFADSMTHDDAMSPSSMKEVSIPLEWIATPGTTPSGPLPVASVGMSCHLGKPSWDNINGADDDKKYASRRPRRVRVTSVVDDGPAGAPLASRTDQVDDASADPSSSAVPPQDAAAALRRQRLSLNVRLSAGVSLIGVLPGGAQVEECYISLTDLNVVMFKRIGMLGEMDLELTLGRLQVDHQRLDAFFPVVLSTPEVDAVFDATPANPTEAPTMMDTPPSSPVGTPRDTKGTPERSTAPTTVAATAARPASPGLNNTSTSSSKGRTVKSLTRHKTRKAVNRSASFGRKQVDGFLHVSVAGFGGGGNRAITRVAYAGVCLQELMLTIDDGFVASVASIFPDALSPSAASRGRSLTALALQSLALPPPTTAVVSTTPASPNDENEVVHEFMHVQHLQLHPLLVDFTFFASPENRALQESPALAILRTVGVIDVDRAPIRLNALLMQNTFGARADITAAVKDHFVGQAIRSFYRLLGAINVLGNPINAWRHCRYVLRTCQGVGEEPCRVCSWVRQRGEDVCL